MQCCLITYISLGLTLSELILRSNKRSCQTNVIRHDIRRSWCLHKTSSESSSPLTITTAIQGACSTTMDASRSCTSTNGARFKPGSRRQTHNSTRGPLVLPKVTETPRFKVRQSLNQLQARIWSSWTLPRASQTCCLLLVLTISHYYTYT